MQSDVQTPTDAKYIYIYFFKYFLKSNNFFFGKEHIKCFIYIPYINSGVFGAIPALFTFLSDSISACHHAPS